MTATMNPFGKTRKIDDPYAVYRWHGWEWRVLKTYQRPDKEEDNQYARWFCAVKSPFTFDSFDMGDTYVSDVLNSGLLVDADDVNGWNIMWTRCPCNIILG